MNHLHGIYYNGSLYRTERRRQNFVLHYFLYCNEQWIADIGQYLYIDWMLVHGRSKI